MPVKITNVSLEPAFAMKRRTASRLQMEPVIAGERLRLRSSRILTDEQAKANTDWLAECERNGVISIDVSIEQGEVGVIEAPPEIKEQEPPAPIEPPQVPPAPPAVDPESPPAPPALPVSTPPSPSEPTGEASPQHSGSRRDDKKRGR